MPTLVLPVSAAHSSFLAAMAEFAAEGRTGDSTSIGSDLAQYGNRWADPDVFAAYVAQLIADDQEDTPRGEGRVPTTTRWWVDGDEYLGRIAIRHRLTEGLRLYGGHIGYDVRLSARRRGNATAMLKAILPIAASLGVDQALLTCSTSNAGSISVIRSAGGILEDEVSGMFRFWLPTGGQPLPR